MFSVPDAPIELQNDGSVTSDVEIRLGWSDGVSDGGAPVIDYSVFYDQGKSVWV